jgi:gluconokinase
LAQSGQEGPVALASMAQAEVFSLVVMGPSACGKSEVGLALANLYGCPFVDADSLHSETNVAKMRNGVPLTDEDRFPWLHTVRKQFVTVLGSRKDTEKFPKKDPPNPPVCAVVACSALRKAYREILRGAYDDEQMKSKCGNCKTVFIFLDCFEDVLQCRISQRQGHFMKAGMLESQLKTLEKPTLDECAITVNGNAHMSAIINEAAEKLSNIFSK